jgi:hypothetical protein
MLTVKKLREALEGLEDEALVRVAVLDERDARRLLYGGAPSFSAPYDLILI